MNTIQDYVDYQLQKIGKPLEELPDEELQQLINTTQKELSMTASASLGLLMDSVVQAKQQQPLKDKWELVCDVKEKEPVHNHLDLVISIHEQVANILENEQWRRNDKKYLAKEILELPEKLPKHHVAFIINRLWQWKNPKHVQYRHQSDPEQLATIEDLFVKEAERRGLDVEKIAKMTRREMDEYIESFRESTP